MRILLLATYEMGRQPFGLASPAAWLREEGHQVACADLAVERLDPEAVERAGLIAFHLPMHTATRLAARVIPRVREWNRQARICCYGLYAPVNAGYLRGLGAEAILGGEFEHGLVKLARGERPRPMSAGARRPELAAAGASRPGETLEHVPLISLERQRFRTPDRNGLPPLERYARLLGRGEPQVVGYTEASRGCRHLCRHCPVAPVYQGAFRIVAREVVLEDIRRQVAAGASHITFGDPDFFNGPGHGLAIVEALQREFPGLTYDVTIKIEHLLRHRRHLAALARTGCLFVTSAAESVDDRLLERLEKHHTRADFIEAVRITREAGLALAPTFLPFTPWTTLAGYRDLLGLLAELELVENVAPIQLAIRLLVPAGSRLLELEEVRALLGPFDEQALSYRWTHPLDNLCYSIQELIREQERRKATRAETFVAISKLAGFEEDFDLLPRAAIPYLNEPWYC
ncbi:MAG: radical SAM protein [Acidobacteria bacterium]|nr:radical SAM protein [Acidobacteriota bacterium]